MKIKTTLIYHSLPIRWAKIQKMNNAVWPGSGETGILHAANQKYTMAQPLRRIIWQYHSKLQKHVPFNTTPCQGIFLKDIVT